MGCTLNTKSHDVFEFYENRLLCEIYAKLLRKQEISAQLYYTNLH